MILTDGVTGVWLVNVAYHAKAKVSVYAIYLPIHDVAQNSERWWYNYSDRLMNKLIYIFAAIALLLGVLIGLQLMMTSSETPPETANGVLPVDSDAPNGEFAEGDEIDIMTDGGLVTVRDVRNLASARNVGNDFYTLTDLFNNPQSVYSFGYDARKQSFLISVRAEPVYANRDVAVQELRELLGVSESEFCQLRVLIKVPYGVGEQYFGEELDPGICE